MDRVHGYLTRDAYWSTGIPPDVLEQALSNSLCFGVYAPDGAQAGFCRVITDRATYAYLADVFLFPEHRGHGLGMWLVQCAMDHPELAGRRSWQLGTRDAHTIYERFGWRSADPSRWMARGVAPSDIYG
jgi:GNAT superfamily N-acetyltransferase